MFRAAPCCAVWCVTEVPSLRVYRDTGILAVWVAAGDGFTAVKSVLPCSPHAVVAGVVAALLASATCTFVRSTVCNASSARDDGRASRFGAYTHQVASALEWPRVGAGTPRQEGKYAS